MNKPGAVTVTRAQVREVHDEIVRLTLADRTVELPAAILPDGIAAGAWVELRVKELAAPETPRRAH
jgi:hypothetical protein